MEIKKSRRMGNLGSVALLSLVVLLTLVGCSTQSPYDEAVGLIKQKEYDEAKEVLETIQSGDSLASKVPIALLTCEIGSLYLQGRLDDAVTLIDSVQESGEQRVYFLNPAPNDTLYSHISSLCMLVVCRLGIPVIEEFLAAPITDSVYNYYASDNWLDQSLVGVLETASDDRRTYQTVDIDDSEGEYSDAPFIRSVGFDKLWVPPEWKSEVDELNVKLSELRQKYNQRWQELQTANIDASIASAYETADENARQNSFASKSEAIEWLTRGSGVWVQEEPILYKKMGIYVKIYNIFKIDQYSGRGTVTVGTASAESMKDVERSSRMETWILSIDRNTVKIALGSEWSTGEMTRTGENTAVLKSIGNMVRQ